VTFNSFEFVYFFVVVYLLYLVLQHRYQNLFLLAASYYFYGSWNPKFLALLFASSVLDYSCGLFLDRHQGTLGRRVALAVSLSANLGMLSVFKYHDFFVASLERLLGSAGFDVSMMRLHVVLPVGISFYTFQTMSYAIDVYRRDLRRAGTSSTSRCSCRSFRSWWPARSSAPPTCCLRCSTRDGSRWRWFAPAYG